MYGRFTLVLLALFLLVSCGKDDPEPTSAIVGTWNLDNRDTEITAPGGDLRHYLVDQLAMGSEEADFWVPYLENGDAAKIDLSTIVFGNEGSYDGIGETGDKRSGTWEITAGNKAVIFDKGSEHEMVVMVQTLTDTELTLEFDLTAKVALPNLTYISILSFARN